MANQNFAKWWQVINAEDERSVRDWFAFLLFTGMRKSDALRLRWSDVDIINGVIHRSGSSLLPIGRFLVDVLKARLEGLPQSE